MIGIFWLLCVSVVVACVVAFLLLLAHKVGIVEYMQVHGDKYISKMAQCDFCMSFWLSVFLMVAIVWVTGYCELILLPVVSTPIARRLL
jgi:hypothetical protein